MKKYLIPIVLIVGGLLIGFVSLYSQSPQFNANRSSDSQKTGALPVSEKVEPDLIIPEPAIVESEPVLPPASVPVEQDLRPVPVPEPSVALPEPPLLSPKPKDLPKPAVQSVVGCGTLSPSVDATEVIVDSVDALRSAVAEANKNGSTTITIKDGTYTLAKSLWVSGSDIFIRSSSGKRDQVVLRGPGMRGDVESVFHISGDRVTIADLTVGFVSTHPIQVHGELDADDVRIHNVRFVDGYQQLLKGSYDAGNTANGSDRGIVECSRFEYSAGIGPNYYIGGIDVHNGDNWIVRDNVFLNIRSPQDELAEHAIHFWSGSRGTLVERNTIVNADRGIGFGLGDRGHVGGIIRKNLILHNSSRGDVGIGLETSPDTQVYDNRIYFENDYKYAIEYRFSATTGVQIHDNVSNRLVRARDGATATEEGNRVNADETEFADELKAWGFED